MQIILRSADRIFFDMQIEIRMYIVDQQIIVWSVDQTHIFKKASNPFNPLDLLGFHIFRCFCFSLLPPWSNGRFSKKILKHILGRSLIYKAFKSFWVFPIWTAIKFVTDEINSQLTTITGKENIPAALLNCNYLNSL